MHTVGVEAFVQFKVCALPTTDKVAWSVSLSVCLSVCLCVVLGIPFSRAKTAEPVEMLFGEGGY